MAFSEYIAVGDSMSIDLYPALDLGETDVAVALERVVQAGAIAPVGAASLFHTNDVDRWPDFAGDDLVSRYPGIVMTNLCVDGATIGDVFSEQLLELEPSESETLITVTVGGNDLLSAFASHRRKPIMATIVRDITQAYEFLVTELARLRPRAELFVTTVYDPSDGTGRMPGVIEDAGALPLEHLDTLNNHIRGLAARTPEVRLADVHAHFLGHGVTAPEAERWYWRRSLIEPSAQGASEIRRVWLEALDAHG
jgi:lysophospholipase L1-like esterase